MTDIKSNLEEVQSKLLPGVQLIAVTKTHSPAEINVAIDNGVTDIGENKVQEILEKYDSVKPVRWHMIGHLQTNKVKYIIDKVCLIHSVDSLKLAKEIDKRARAAEKTMDILIQVNPAHEESKFGLDPGDVEALINDILEQCPNVRICGLMCIAPYTDDPQDVRPYFAEVRKMYEKFGSIDNENIDFKYLSMGMSHDFEAAQQEGSNMVRVGTAIFGARVY
ncbi:MAG: YggS family pyridoxal phosphate-dependent enzyme [Anaerovoracaceae bacterium]|nr:YggS family pyridoxal phosphate-dependent enzyme [Anaerovoracaceae bacterium]